MKYILYYSNFCKHCENILSILSKSQLKDSIYFVNIDNRVVENGKMCILLQNGKKLVLPKSVKEVPSLILLHQGNIVLEGKQILDYFKDALKKEESYEPLAFSMDEMNGMSDGYSYLDMTSDQMSAKGDGGTRIMHSFASLQGETKIETPPDNYEPNKVGDVSLETLQQQRNAEIPKQLQRT
jgi:hypothetical protein